MRWFDADLDLACLAENGRDMTRRVADCGGPWLPASVTFPTLAEGGVAACLGTIFTEMDGDDAVRYPAEDAEAAHAAGVRQLERYESWEREGRIELWKWQGGGAGKWQSGEVAERQSGEQERRPIRLGILMECADPIRTPDELGWWAERGVMAVGMAWARGSRYAAGNSEPSCSSPVGLTGLGRALARRIDELGLVHDVSHLSDRALADLFSLTDRRVMASHSNCRALLDGKNQRHLTDEAIGEIGRRGGVIGLNLVRNFIRTGLNREDPNDRPSIDEAIGHVEHVCGIMGRRSGVGMGSDLDGGISAHDLPAGIDGPRDFVKFAAALERRGWSAAEVEGFAWGNWARFFGAPVALAERTGG
jgi:membrane dipeptidase